MAPLWKELALDQPGLATGERPSLDVARRYCLRLAKSHYENFSVAHWLLPSDVRQHFANVYAYCRGADDLADETDDPAESLAKLDEWEQELNACYRGAPRHPVFIALADTIERYALPREPFADLLVAFRQDQRVTRYETAAEVAEYCRYSANPVGRIVLGLARANRDELTPLSDSICTGLQLVNFCQDVARDWDRGRVYLPQETLRSARCEESVFERRESSAAFREALRWEVGRAEACLRAGESLVAQMPAGFRFSVALFVEGGLAIAREIHRIEYDVWRRRPTVSKLHKALLFPRAWRRAWRRARAGGRR